MPEKGKMNLDRSHSRTHPVCPSTWKSMGWRYGYRGVRIPGRTTSFLHKFEDPLLCPQILSVTLDFDQVLADVSQFPDKLQELTARQFEAFVAEIWKRFGYEVELTSRTRDGGRDIVAVKSCETNLRFLIECKRYDRNRKVGVGIVRALYGVKMDEKATKAILATTSSFTRGALNFFVGHIWELEPRDYDGIVDWVRRAQTTSLNAARPAPH